MADATQAPNPHGRPRPFGTPAQSPAPSSSTIPAPSTTRADAPPSLASELAAAMRQLESWRDAIRARLEQLEHDDNTMSLRLTTIDDKLANIIERLEALEGDASSSAAAQHGKKHGK